MVECNANHSATDRLRILHGKLSMLISLTFGPQDSASVAAALRCQYTKDHNSNAKPSTRKLRTPTHQILIRFCHHPLEMIRWRRALLNWAYPTGIGYDYERSLLVCTTLKFWISSYKNIYFFQFDSNCWKMKKSLTYDLPCCT